MENIVVKILIAYFVTFFLYAEFTLAYEKITPKEMKSFMQDFGKCIEKKDAKCFNEKVHPDISYLDLKIFDCNVKDKKKSTQDELVTCAFKGKMYEVLQNCFVKKIGKLSKNGENIILPDAYVCYVTKENGKLTLFNIVFTD